MFTCTVDQTIVNYINRRRVRGSITETDVNSVLPKLFWLTSVRYSWRKRYDAGASKSQLRKKREIINLGDARKKKSSIEVYPDSREEKVFPANDLA